MEFSRTIRVVVLIFGVSLCAVAQNDAPSQGTTPPATRQETTTGPVPAFGQNDTPILNPDNPPISGLDQPTLESRPACR
jgi:hypothetical protein